MCIAGTGTWTSQQIAVRREGCHKAEGPFSKALLKAHAKVVASRWVPLRVHGGVTDSSRRYGNATRQTISDRQTVQYIHTYLP